MKLPSTIKSIIIETVCLLYVLLFVYAALNKLLDFENFQVQLGQSPLLSAFAGWISYAVPATEFLIVILLLIGRLRHVGLFASFCLMVLFTAYIFIMLHFSPFVPCSCGGVLEKLSWNQHLLFNIVFTVLALIAFVLHKSETNILVSFKQQFAALSTALIISVGLVGVMFVLSEDTIHHRNNFTRRYPKHPTNFKHSIELPYNSYYIAGYDTGHIYLGNRTAPLTVTVMDTALTYKKQFLIQLPKYKFPYTSPRLNVRPPYFYFTDGTVPCIFVGNISDWKAQLKMYQKAYFSIFEPIGNEKATIRAIGIKTKENVLGIIDFKDSDKLSLNYNLLKKQVDGVFDTDGMLVYNKQLDRIIYTYYYRNEFLNIDPQLTSHTIGHTIDTTSRAQVKVATIQSKKVKTLARQPMIVNKKTATYGKYLFVDAALIGKFEPAELWQQASIIDVYDIIENTYAFSFYINDEEDEKISEFIIINDLVVSLTGKHLRIEQLRTNYYKPWRQ